MTSGIRINSNHPVGKSSDLFVVLISLDLKHYIVQILFWEVVVVASFNVCAFGQVHQKRTWRQKLGHIWFIEWEFPRKLSKWIGRAGQGRNKWSMCALSSEVSALACACSRTWKKGAGLSCSHTWHSLGLGLSGGGHQLLGTSSVFERMERANPVIVGQSSEET